MKHQRHSLFVAGLMGLAVWLSTGSVHALSTQPNASSITVSPAVLNFSLAKPDDQQSLPITVTNSYDVPVRLNGQFRAMVADNGHFLPGGVLDSATAQSLTLSQSDFVVAPRNTQTITVTFRDVTALAPGGHYATLVLSQENAGGQLTLQANLSLTIFAVKATGAHTALQLQNYHVNGWLFAAPSLVTTTFQDTGNVHVVPRAVVNVHAGSRLVSQGIDNSGSLPVLPGKQIFTEAPLKQLVNAWLPGRLHITITYHPDGINTTRTVSLDRWYIPPFYPIGLIILLVIWHYLAKHGRQQRLVRKRARRLDKLTIDR